MCAALELSYLLHFDPCNHSSALMAVFFACHFLHALLPHLLISVVVTKVVNYTRKNLLVGPRHHDRIFSGCWAGSAATYCRAGKKIKNQSSCDAWPGPVEGK